MGLVIFALFGVARRFFKFSRLAGAIQQHDLVPSRKSAALEAQVMCVSVHTCDVVCTHTSLDRGMPHIRWLLTMAAADSLWAMLQGCVLEEYTMGVEDKLRALELESIQDYITESDNLVDLHQQVGSSTCWPGVMSAVRVVCRPKQPLASHS